MARDSDGRPAPRLAWLPRLVAVSVLAGGIAGLALPDEPRQAAPEEEAVRREVNAWRHGDGGLRVTDPLLAAGIEAVRAECPSFDGALQRVDASGIPVIVGTAEQLERVLPPEIRTHGGWMGITVAWGRSDGSLRRVAVAIRADGLREIHRSYGNPEAVFSSALEDLLIHEIYGHAVPMVDARLARGVCPDPRPGQHLAESCAGRRELEVRAERRAYSAH